MTVSQLKTKVSNDRSKQKHFRIDNNIIHYNVCNAKVMGFDSL